jgi:hypothetical protein
LRASGSRSDHRSDADRNCQALHDLDLSDCTNDISAEADG